MESRSKRLSILSLIHVLVGLVAVIVGLAIFGLRKGDPRHRLLGWIYLACLMISLAAIVARRFAEPTPFSIYAAIIMGVLLAALLASRLRSNIAAWRSWHGALMSFSMLAAGVAIGGVVGGVVLGIGNGPAYFRMFNVVAFTVTVAGLGIINTRPVIWGRSGAAAERAARLWFSALVVTVSAGLVLGQHFLQSG